jgi:hypothetical protein
MNILDPNFLNQNLLHGISQQFTQPQAATPATPPRRNFGGVLRDALPTLLMGLGAEISSNWRGGGSQFLQNAGAQQQERSRNETAINVTTKWLEQRHPDAAELVRSGAISPMDGIKMAMQKPEQPSSVQEYEYARQNGFNGSFMDFQSAKQGQAGPETLGLNPIMAADAQGRPMMFQPGNRGTLKQMQFPEGVTPLSPYDTSFQKASGAEGGKLRAGALDALPGAAAKVDDIDAKVDALLNHPKFNSMVGPLDAWTPNITGGANDWQSRFNQLAGESFLQAREQLKGGGAITDFEGQKAQQALNRATQSTDEASFRQAMQEFKMHVRRGYEILAQQAGRGGGGMGAAPGQWSIEEVR